MEQNASSCGSRAGRQPARTVFLAFLALGLTSFGGPVAHIGYFREAFVARRRWMDERGYADLVALCQMLPGPTSSQVGIGIGLTKAGLAGAVAAWVGFTAPSAILLIALGYGVIAFDDADSTGSAARSWRRRRRGGGAGGVGHGANTLPRSAPDHPREQLLGTRIAR